LVSAARGQLAVAAAFERERMQADWQAAKDWRADKISMAVESNEVREEAEASTSCVS
jgi:hypothetical protein